MKIAITGHSAGIGQALAKVYLNKGHEIVGLSRRNGYNIRSIPKILAMIEPCDMFINNAQAGFAQTELLYKVCEAWQGKTDKRIMVISTMSTLCPVSPLPGLGMDEYRTQKIALEEATRQLAHINVGPKFTLVKPGSVATQPGETVPPCADPDEWAEALVNCLESVGPHLEIPEISLNTKYY
jgi:NAD(P)-dependent dehydrogenase (short-subunit alcohol dehydrogenase family)